MANARIVKFCARVGYIKSWDDKRSPNGHSPDRVTHFCNMGPGRSYAFRISVQIDNNILQVLSQA